MVKKGFVLFGYLIIKKEDLKNNLGVLVKDFDEQAHYIKKKAIEEDKKFEEYEDEIFYKASLTSFLKYLFGFDYKYDDIFEIEKLGEELKKSA